MAVGDPGGDRGRRPVRGERGQPSAGHVLRRPWGTLYLTIPIYRQLGPLWAVSNLAWLAIVAAAIGSLVVRYRRGGDAERRQLLWLVLAVLAVVAYVGIPWGIFNTGPILGLLVIALIPVAITIAILRYQLLDIRLVVSRALIYGILTAAAAGAYVGVVAILDALVRSRVSLGSAVIASVVIAIGFNPARVRLQRLIDRALYGDRRDPVRAVSLVGGRLAGTGAAGLKGVPEALCESLRLPFAAVRFGSVETAAHGAMPELLHTTGLSYDGARIGELVVGLRSGQRGSARLTSRSLSCWLARSPSPCTPRPCRRRCRNRGSAWWPRVRRSVAGSAAICTTGSVRP